MAHHNHHTPSQLDLYEGDQSKLYSGVLSHAHGSVDGNESKNKVSKIWWVTLLLTVVTIWEVAVGLWAHTVGVHNVILLVYFIVLTLVKAGYIVSVFMHLGDERKAFRMFVLAPMLLFIWIIISFLMDGDHWLHMNDTFADTIKSIFKK